MKVNKDVVFTYNLFEAVGQGPKFSILDKEGNIRNKPVRCKDYFQDAYWAEITGKDKIKQYGFEWDGKNLNPVSKQRRVLTIMMSDNNTDLWILKNRLLNFLNPIEKELKLFKTKIIKDDDTSFNIVLDYDNKWSKKPYLLSLFYLLTRIGIYYKGKADIEEILNWLNKDAINEVFYVDKQMILQLVAKNKFNKLLKEKIIIPQKWEDYKASYQIHDNSGIVSCKF